MAALDSRSAALATMSRGAARVVNVGMALLLLAVAFPLFLLIPLAILIVDGKPAFYRGQRLGRYKKPFTIFKFRTLVRNAEAIVGGGLLSQMSHRHNLTVRYIGTFLRDTRLDELPQLFNVLKGDMNFFGPRPERREVYESQCKEIPCYERRFTVKPGIVGYSQLFTPHGTPKRLRTLIDNGALRRQPGPFQEARLVAYTAAVVMRRSLVMASAYLHSEVLRSRVLRLYREARELNRVRLRGAVVYVDPSADGSCACQASLVNMNDEAFLMHCRQPLPDGVQRSFKLRIQSRRRRRRSRIKTAVCKGSIEQTRSVGDTYAYVVRYKAATTSSQYVIEQHFLRKSLAHP